MAASKPRKKKTASTSSTRPARKASAAKAPATKRRGASKTTLSGHAKKPLPPLRDGEVRLLTGGNPQIAKADGDAPVQAYIAAMPGWKSALGKRLDALIVSAVPKKLGLRKAVKWNTPLYGVPGNGWFVGFGVFTRYVKVTFFFGAKLSPLPPGASKDQNARHLDLHEDDVLDEAQFKRWVKQAAGIPGWISGKSD